MILGAAAFGQPTHWGDSKKPPPGHQMDFKEAICRVSDYLGLRAALPPWVWGNAETRAKVGLGGIAAKGWLGNRIQKTAVAFAELQVSDS